MKTLRKYKHSRLALLLWTALAIALGYVLATLQCASPPPTPLATRKDATVPATPQEPQPNPHPDKRIPIGPTDI